MFNSSQSDRVSGPADQTQRLRQVLDGIIATLVPHLLTTPDSKAEDALPAPCPQSSGLPRAIAELTAPQPASTDSLLRKLSRSAHRRTLEKCLLGLESPLRNGLLFGIPQRFSEMPSPQKTQLLHRWSCSPSRRLRLSWQMIAVPALYSTYAQPLTAQLVHQAIGYPLASLELSSIPKDRESIDLESAQRDSVDHDSSNRHSITLDRIEPKQKLDPVESLLGFFSETADDFDTVVVGSGAGGSVAAATLAQAGERVLIVEQGSLVARAQLGSGEWLGNAMLFDKSDGMLTEGDFVRLLSAKTVGGGSIVQWMTALAPEQSILREWRDRLGVDLFDESWEESLDAVRQRLSIKADPSCENANNRMLRIGSQRLGLSWTHLPRSAQCSTCDPCISGCPHGKKQDARRTFLRDAQLAHAQLWPQAQALKILVQNQRAIGIEVVLHEPPLVPRIIRIKAKRIVLSAGALRTPALLQASGLGNAHVGRHLALHPTAIVVSKFAERIEPWRGAPQSVLCDHWAVEPLHANGLSQDGGIRLEVAPMHPGFAAMAIPWQSGYAHKQAMSQLAHLANIIVLLRDRGRGRVNISPRGIRIRYRLSRREIRRVQEGIDHAARIHWAAGAQSVWLPHGERLDQERKLSNAALTNESHRASDRSATWRPDSEFGSNPLAASSRRHRTKRLCPWPLFSAHQLASCRMGATAELGACGLDGQVFGVSGLYVADGSLLPNACGVNPMITIMALAHRVANRWRDSLA